MKTYSNIVYFCVYRLCFLLLILFLYTAVKSLIFPLFSMPFSELWYQYLWFTNYVKIILACPVIVEDVINGNGRMSTLFWTTYYSIPLNIHNTLCRAPLDSRITYTSESGRRGGGGGHSPERAIQVSPAVKTPFSCLSTIHQTPSYIMLQFWRPWFSKILDF